MTRTAAPILLIWRWPNVRARRVERFISLFQISPLGEELPAPRACARLKIVETLRALKNPVENQQWRSIITTYPLGVNGGNSLSSLNIDVSFLSNKIYKQLNNQSTSISIRHPSSQNNFIIIAMDDCRLGQSCCIWYSKNKWSTDYLEHLWVVLQFCLINASRERMQSAIAAIANSGSLFCSSISFAARSSGVWVP